MPIDDRAALTQSAMPLAPTKDAAGHVEGWEPFIKYLPQETTAPELKTWFGEAGEIVGEARLMTHPQTGKCKGIGWITFATEKAFAAALTWDGCEYGGRRLAISSATKQHTGFRPSVQAPGTHTPALLQEVLRAMVAPNPSGVYVDATFGRGGHTRGMLGALSPQGSLHAFDMDPDAVKVPKPRGADSLPPARSRPHLHATCTPSPRPPARPPAVPPRPGGRRARRVLSYRPLATAP